MQEVSGQVGSSGPRPWPGPCMAINLEQVPAPRLRLHWLVSFPGSFLLCDL